MHGMESSFQLETPYQKVGQIYDERVGRVARYGYWLQILLALMLGVIGLLAYALHVQANKVAVQPVFLKVYSTGETEVLYSAETTTTVSAQMYTWFVTEYIRRLRARSSDPVVVTEALRWVYGVSTKERVAEMREDHNKKDPLKEAGERLVSVEVTRTLQRSSTPTAQTWDVTWVETVVDAATRVPIETMTHSGLITIKEQKAHTKKELTVNHLGWLVDRLVFQ